MKAAVQAALMPSPNDLTYFVEVAGTLNLSRAAERLGICQPSLSLAMQRLENAIGTRLFIRNKKGVILTQPGKQLLVHTKDLLQSWENAKGQALASVRGVQGSYTLGCHTSIALYTLPLFLPALLEDFPQLELRLIHDLSRKITESVIRMETDLGLVVNPVRHPDLIIRKICEDEVTFWVGEGKTSVQDFRSGEAVLICDPALLQSQVLLKKMEKSGIRYRRILASSSLEVVTRLVSQGAGIGIIPARVVGGLGDVGIKRIPRAPVFKDEVCLLFRVENKGVRSIQEMAGRAMSIFSANLKSLPRDSGFE